MRQWYCKKAKVGNESAIFRLASIACRTITILLWIKCLLVLTTFERQLQSREGRKINLKISWTCHSVFLQKPFFLFLSAFRFFPYLICNHLLLRCSRYFHRAASRKEKLILTFKLREGEREKTEGKYVWVERGYNSLWCERGSKASTVFFFQFMWTAQFFFSGSRWWKDDMQCKSSNNEKRN